MADVEAPPVRLRRPVVRDTEELSGSAHAFDSGANYYGVVADGANVTITGATIHDIGENPFNGTQHGVGVLYTTVHKDESTDHPRGDWDA